MTGAKLKIMAVALAFFAMPAMGHAATTTVFAENFNSTPEGQIPSGWEQDGNWGVIPIDEAGVEGLLITDLTSPYQPNANNAVFSPTIDLGEANAATIEFFSVCDTEISATDYTDFVVLIYSNDGTEYEEQIRWDEFDLHPIEGTADFTSALFSWPIPAEYLVSTFSFGFQWVSNDNEDNGTYGIGCLIDDVSVSASADDPALADTVAPAITMLGENPMRLFVGDTYAEPGATAFDLVDGDVTGSISATGTVDSTVAGEYYVDYLVSDAAGNATSSTRTVVVEEHPAEPAPADTTAPVITLIGEGAIALTVGDVYAEPGATATDDASGDLTASIVITGTVDTAVAGTYVLAYSVSDAASNTASTTRTVTVSAPPVVEEPEVVVSLDLSDLTVNGSTVSGFAASVTSYNVELPFGTAEIPQVAATAADATTTVSVVQATALPGTATVTVTAPNGTDTKAYTVSFTVAEAHAPAPAPSHGGGGGGGKSSKEKIAPTSVTIKIDNGAASTNDLAVEIALDADDNKTKTSDLRMRISNDPKFKGAKWEKFKYWTPWTLPKGDGPKKVYFQVRDEAGNESAVVSDSIMLKQTVFGTSAATSTGSVLGASTYKFTKNLKLGSKGAEVTALQERMKKEGLYVGEATGTYGLKTALAVKAYQKKNGIKATGKTDKKTRAKLNK